MKFRELFENKEEDLIIKELQKVGVVQSVNKHKSLGIVVELEGDDDEEYYKVQEKIDDLEESGKIEEMLWYVDPMDKKELKEFAKTASADITPNIKDILKVNSIVRVHQ